MTAVVDPYDGIPGYWKSDWTDRFVIYRHLGDSAVIFERKTGRDVFLQPGDDANQFWKELDIVDRHLMTDSSMRERLVDQVCGEYFVGLPSPEDLSG